MSQKQIESARFVLEHSLDWCEEHLALFDPTLWKPLPMYRGFPEAVLCELLLGLRSVRRVPGMHERCTRMVALSRDGVDWKDFAARRAAPGSQRRYFELFEGTILSFDPPMDRSLECASSGRFHSGQPPTVDDVETAFARHVLHGARGRDLPGCPDSEVRQVLRRTVDAGRRQADKARLAGVLYALTHVVMYAHDFGDRRPDISLLDSEDAASVEGWCDAALRDGDLDLGGELALALCLSGRGTQWLETTLRLMYQQVVEHGVIRGPLFAPADWVSLPEEAMRVRYTFSMCYHVTVVAMLCAAELLGRAALPCRQVGVDKSNHVTTEEFRRSFAAAARQGDVVPQESAALTSGALFGANDTSPMRSSSRRGAAPPLDDMD